ncbi:Ig-like domain-containing protein [Pontiella sulfatireligans]|nr:Ig-like domain-containing protein [Pontiella sulfatireligans]
MKNRKLLGMGLVMAGMFISSSHAAPVITVINRAGTDVSGQTLIASDHIHISTTSSVPVEAYAYKCLVQSAEPTEGEWTAVASQKFYEDLYFYMEPATQWVQVSVTDTNASSTNAVYGLAAGILTAAPDDPILPADYVAAMKEGFIEEPKDMPEDDIVATKKGGFGHFRIHWGKDIYTAAELKVAVAKVMRHGLYCHPALSSPEDFDKWRTAIGEIQFFSHRMAIEPCLEHGYDLELDEYYRDLTEETRFYPGNANRIMIYHTHNLNDLPNLTAPYADLNPDDGITTGSGDYYFYAGHSPGNWLNTKHLDSEADKLWWEENADLVLNQMNILDKPVLVDASKIEDSRYLSGYKPSALRAYQYQRQYLDDRARYKVNRTFLTMGAYIEDGEYTDAKAWQMVIAGGRGDIIRPNDPDGDLVSTYDEINVYGTDPYDCDSDWDNIMDTFECGWVPGLNPNDPRDGFPTLVKGSLTNFTDRSINADMDGDGLGNAWELLAAVPATSDPATTEWSFHIDDPSDAEQDLDHDLLINFWDTGKIGPYSGRDANDLNVEGLQNFDRGENNIDEILAGTWYRDTTDDDEDGLVGEGIDLVPYVGDREFAVRFTFNESISGSTLANTASMGSTDYLATPLPDGTLVGSLSGYADRVLDCSEGSGFIHAPATHLGSVSNRSVSLWFAATEFGGEAEPYQVLYKDGDTSAGRSIYLNQNKLWIGIWATSNSTLLETHIDLHATDGVPALESNQWYAVTLVSDGATESLRGYLFKDNAWLTRVEATDLGIGLIDSASGKTTFCGSDDSSRFWDPSAGASVVRSGAYFKGYLDDSLIWNRSLTDVETSWLSRDFIFEPKTVALPAAPLARDDRLHVTPEEETTLWVLDNDIDINGDPISITSFTPPQHGTLTQIDSTSFIYTPDEDYAGEDTFTYIATDGTSLSETATVTLEVYVGHFRTHRGTATLKRGWESTTLTAGVDYHLERSSTAANAFIRLVGNRLCGGANTEGVVSIKPGHQLAFIENPSNLADSITISREGVYKGTRKGPSRDFMYDQVVNWEILEYIGPANGRNAMVVRDQAMITTNTASAVNSILDPNKTVVFISGQASGSDSAYLYHALHTAELNASNQPIFSRMDGSAINGMGIVSYAVVEFTGSNWAPVRRIEQDFASSSTTTAAITPPLREVSKAFLHVQQRATNSGADHDTGNVWISDADELSFSMPVSANNHAVVWVVENLESDPEIAMNVQQLSNQTRTANTAAPSPDVWTQPIQPVSATENASIMGECAHTAQSAGSNNTFSEGQVLFSLANPQEVSCWHVSRAKNLTYSFSVVEWPRMPRIPPPDIARYNFPSGSMVSIDSENNSMASDAVPHASAFDAATSADGSLLATTGGLSPSGEPILAFTVAADPGTTVSLDELSYNWLARADHAATHTTRVWCSVNGGANTEVASATLSPTLATATVVSNLVVDLSASQFQRVTSATIQVYHETDGSPGAHYGALLSSASHGDFLGLTGVEAETYQDVTLTRNVRDTDNDSIDDDLDPDDDGDQLTDAEEAALGTNPLLADSDGAGINDGAEVAAGSNPMNPMDDDYWIPGGEMIQFACNRDAPILDLYNPDVTGGMSFSSGIWTNARTATSGDDSQSIMSDDGFMTFDPTGANLIIYATAYTNLTEESTFGGNLANLGVDGGADSRKVDVDERIVFRFNQEVALKHIQFAGARDFTLSWGDGQSNSLIGTSSYTFDATERLPQDATLTVTGDSGSQGFTALIVELIGTRADSDEDGMPDIAETFYGFKPDDPADANGDADADGMSNGNELFAGTLPNDPESVFAISGLYTGVASNQLLWMSVPGRTYFVEYSTNLNEWLLLPGAENVLAVDVDSMITDTNSMEAVRFYRAGVWSE